MTRKWGSCSPAGRVSFAADLLARPKRFQERVILHELLHLRVANHGRLHRAYVSAYGPGFVKVEGTETCVKAGGAVGIGVGGSAGSR